MGLHAAMLLSVHPNLVLAVLLIASLAVTLWSALAIWQEIKDADH
jgi:hypothetical protein